MTDHPTQVRPALTPEEWAVGKVVRPFARPVLLGEALTIAPDPDDPQRIFITDQGEEYALVEPHMRHALAALALHGQPFGFTREHLSALRLLLNDKLYYLQDEGPAGEGWKSPEAERAIALLAEVADRIAALLPPEGR